MNELRWNIIRLTSNNMLAMELGNNAQQLYDYEIIEECDPDATEREAFNRLKEIASEKGMRMVKYGWLEDESNEQ